MYFTEEAESLFKELLQPTDTFDISDGAVWPDSNGVRTHMPYSRPWHFIDAKDNPPKTCTINYSADCDPDKRCVVYAIVNMTSHVNNPGNSKEDQNNALKFLLHFLGDITQPLHTEEKCKGGNNIMVQWGKPGSKEEKLHEVWDSLIIKKLRGYKKPREADPDNVYDKGLSMEWATELNEKINGGEVVIDEAAECVDISTPEKCALKWAGEANKFVCTYVLKDGKNLGRDRDDDDCQWEWQGPADVSKEYYEGAVPIVVDQIAKAGWRLGQWVNALAAQRAQMKKNGVVFDEGLLKVQPQVEL